MSIQLTNITYNSVIEKPSNDTHEPNGFTNRIDSTLVWTDTSPNRTLKINGTYSIYCDSIKYTKTNDSKQITTDVGLHSVYYDNSGVLQESLIFPGFQYCLVAFVYWNGSNGLASDERHGIVMDNATHEWAHDTIGARYGNGLGATFSDSSLSIDPGAMFDEDLEHTYSGTTTSVPIFYRNGSNWNWTAPISTVFYKTGAPAHIQYDNSGTITSAAGDYVAYWVFATNDLTYPIISIMGQRKDTNINNARSNNTYQTLVFGTLPYVEMKLLFRVIVRDVASPYQETQDLRSVSNVSSGTYVATSHGALTGLLNNDHTQYQLRSEFGVITHTVTAGEDAAGYADIATGLLVQPTKFFVQGYRSNANILHDWVITTLTGGGNDGKIRVADGATINVVENDVINIMAWE